MPNIEHSIPISANPETVYPLVATAKGLAQWWAEDVTEAEGVVALGFFKRATVYRLSLHADLPPSQAEWVCDPGDQWSGTRIRYRLEKSASGTLLRFTHAGWRSETDYFTACNTTWGELMFRLKAAADGKPRGPLFLAADMAY